MTVRHPPNELWGRWWMVACLITRHQFSEPWPWINNSKVTQRSLKGHSEVTQRSLRGYFNWVVLAVSFLLRSHKHVSLLHLVSCQYSHKHVSLLHLVSCQYSHTLPIENVPEPHTAVTWPRSNIVTIWMKLAALHKDNMHRLWYIVSTQNHNALCPYCLGLLS